MRVYRLSEIPPSLNSRFYIMMGGGLQLQKCNDEQQKQAWILPLTSKIVHCITYNYDLFTSEFIVFIAII